MNKIQYLHAERAHLMCPNMHFGIKAKVKASYDYNRFKSSLIKLEKAHPFLQCVISQDNKTKMYYYDFNKNIHINFLEKSNEKNWQTDYIEAFKNGWNVLNEALLKIIVYPGNDEFDFILISHHLLGDGKSLLQILNEFVNCYIKDIEPPYAYEKLITSINDLPHNSNLNIISKFVINSANRNWNKENHTVDYLKYHDFEIDFIYNNPVTFTEETIKEKDVKLLHEKCQKENITINDYLIAEMMIKEHTNKVIIAADIRKYLSC